MDWFITTLKLNISEADNTQDLALAKSVAGVFRISRDSADIIIQEVMHAVSTWRKEANNLGISSQQQDMMKNAL